MTSKKRILKNGSIYYEHRLYDTRSDRLHCFNRTTHYGGNYGHRVHGRLVDRSIWGDAPEKNSRSFYKVVSFPNYKEGKEAISLPTKNRYKPDKWGFPLPRKYKVKKR